MPTAQRLLIVFWGIAAIILVAVLAFALRHKSELAQPEAAFRALDKQIVIDVENAA